MGNPDDGIKMEARFAYNDTWPQHRVQAEKDMLHRELWARVGQHFRDGGAGVVTYYEEDRPIPFMGNGMECVMTVHIFSEARADAIYRRLQEIEAKVRASVEGPKP